MAPVQTVGRKGQPILVRQVVPVAQEAFKVVPVVRVARVARQEQAEQTEAWRLIGRKLLTVP